MCAPKMRRGSAGRARGWACTSVCTHGHVWTTPRTPGAHARPYMRACGAAGQCTRAGRLGSARVRCGWACMRAGRLLRVHRRRRGARTNSRLQVWNNVMWVSWHAAARYLLHGLRAWRAVHTHTRAPQQWLQRWRVGADRCLLPTASLHVYLVYLECVSLQSMVTRPCMPGPYTVPLHVDNI